MKALTEMSDKEKKNFFSMDLAERMIRVEQNVSASFNRYVPYYQTEYYKSMNERQKEDFKKYLKHKKRKKFLSVLSIFLPLILAGFLSFSITGNVIAEEIGQENSSMLVISLIIVFFILFFYFFYSSILRKKLDRKMNNYVKTLNNIVSRH